MAEYEGRIKKAKLAAHQSIPLPTAFSTNLTDAEANQPKPYLESPVVLEGALLTRDDVTAAAAAAVEDVVEAVGGGAASDAVGRSRGRRQRRVPEVGVYCSDLADFNPSFGDNMGNFV